LSELHGIPLLFKDNVGTDVSLGMNTTAGNYAFLGSETPGDLGVRGLHTDSGMGGGKLGKLMHAYFVII
jgi:Asp-tRNA(Asn)/Glu-tRNA(Gln) amidotransferase A subunit family amidase